MHTSIKSTLRVKPSRKRRANPPPTASSQLRLIFRRSAFSSSSLLPLTLLQMCDKFMVTCVRLQEEKKERNERNHWIGTLRDKQNSCVTGNFCLSFETPATMMSFHSVIKCSASIRFFPLPLLRLSEWSRIWMIASVDAFHFFQLKATKRWLWFSFKVCN